MLTQEINGTCTCIHIYNCFEKGRPTKVYKPTLYVTKSKGIIIGNGGLRCLDWSCKVFHRDRRKQHNVLILSFPSCWNYVNLNPVTINYHYQSTLWSLTFSRNSSCIYMYMYINRPNRPFYSSLLGDLGFEWQRGWRRPCFDTDLSAFVMTMYLS